MITMVGIVKNEARVLERCLESCRGLVDDYLCFDTGSQDGTQEIIKRYGDLQTLEFTNYAETKNAALEIAEKGLLPDDYIVLLDADESMVAGHAVLKRYAEEKSVAAVAGLIVEQDRDGNVVNQYYRVRMWRADGSWRYQGPGVHEFCSGNGDVVYDARVVTLHDHSHRTPDDGEALRQRFLWYREVFQAAVQQNDADARSWFYLARTNKDLGEAWPAIDAYERYLEIPDNQYRDERWQASYDVAVLWKFMGEYDKAFRSLERCQTIDPGRAEALVLGGMIHYARQDWEAAVPFFEKATQLPVPMNCLLFVDPRQYGTMPLDLLCLCLDHLHRYDRAYEVSSLMAGGAE